MKHKKLTYLASTLIYAAIGKVHTTYADLKNDLQQSVEDTSPNVQSNRDVDEARILHEAQDVIFQVVGIIAVIMVLYSAYRFLIAKGSVDDFKKEAKALIFIIIGLAIIPFSYFIIQYLTNLYL